MVLLLALAGFAAGFVDAVVGGGGLIQLPALLLGLPNASPVQVLATNKLASFCGTTVASATYYRRVRPDPRTFLPLMALAFLGSALGAGVAFLIPRSAFEPIVLVALIVVGTYVVLKPDLGSETMLRFHGHRHTAMAMLVGLRDRVLRRRARTGHRLVLRVRPRRPARLRLPGGVRQGPAGQLGHQPGRALRVRAARRGAVGDRAGDGRRPTSSGAYLGARTAVARGSRFVRVFFIVVVSAFIVVLGGQVFGVW